MVIKLPLIHLSVFTCGFVVMAFEVTGSRVLAPFLGTSMFVWTSIIGIILLAMSGGYAYGGRLADRKASHANMAFLILSAAFAILVMNIGKGYFLRGLQEVSAPLLLKSATGALVLFSVPAFLLAAVFPFSLRLMFSDMRVAGRDAGRIYALSTLGSLCGTFAAATFLLPFFGTTHVLWILGTLLIINAGFLVNQSVRKKLLVVASLLVVANVLYAFYPRVNIDIDTAYNRVWILDGFNNGRPTRTMQLNGHVNSGIFTDNPSESLFPYTEYVRLAEHFNPGFQRTLLIGAGAFSIPRLVQHRYPETRLDVVEIDDRLLAFSERHFEYQLAPNTQTFHADGRSFLNENRTRYDLIFNDVFTSPLDVPFQLCTRESYALMYAALKKGGVLMVNVLGSLGGEGSLFLKAQVKTMESVFDEVYVFQVKESSSHHLKNNILVGIREATFPPLIHGDSALQKMMNNSIELATEEAFILTDDYAPVEWMLAQ